MKYLSNFWASLDLPLINCELEFNLSWTKDSIISDMLGNTKVPANLAANAPFECIPKGSTTDATIEANNAKLVPIVTLSINDNIKFLKKVKQGRI